MNCAICDFFRYHNRATLVVSALQVEKHPFVSDVANQLELKLSAKDEDTDTIASIGETKSLGVHSPFKANRFVFANSMGGMGECNEVILKVSSYQFPPVQYNHGKSS
jgi:hypothetical protein